MKFRITLLCALCAFALNCFSSEEILFVGNSFTFCPKTIATSGNLGGVAALFAQLAKQGGFDVSVTMLAEGGKNLRHHIDSNAPELARRWDKVVLQDHSTGLLGKPEKMSEFLAAVPVLAETMRKQHPGVVIYLYETWANPKRAAEFGGIEKMQAGLRAAYLKAAQDNKLAGAAAVGEVFMTAHARGVSIWGPDGYHQNAMGAYLSALVFYKTLLGGKIDAVPAGKDSVAARFGISGAGARLLHGIVHETQTVLSLP